MWEKAAFLAFFVELCLAQRDAVLDLHGRKANAMAHERLSSDKIETPQLVSSQTVARVLSQSLDHPRILELRDPQDGQLPPGVFTTVLFPDVPTVAPTGVAVPTVMTFTGAFDATLIPPGYSDPFPTDAGRTMAEGSQPAPTQSQVTPFMRPTDVPTSAQQSDMPQPTQSDLRSQSDRPIPTQSQSHEPSSRASLSSSISTSSTPTSSTSSASTSSSASSRTSSSLSSTSHTMPNSSATAGAKSSSSAPDRNPHLSSGAIAGIVIGVVAGIAGLAALLLFLLSRRKREKAPDSPGIYPQEAYLYDPPVTPPNDGPGGGMGAGAMANHNIGRSATPEMAATESSGLLGGAGALTAAGAAARGRSGTLSGQNAPARPLLGASGGLGGGNYAPVNTRELAEMSSANPFRDPPGGAANPYRDEPLPAPSASNARSWPLNKQPQTPSRLDTTAGGAGLPVIPDGLESRGQTPASMYRDEDLGGGPGPSIAGVGSQRYERRVSGSPGPGPAGQLSPTLGTPTAGAYNPAMREARRAWGMDG